LFLPGERREKPHEEHLSSRPGGRSALAVAAAATRWFHLTYLAGHDE
jgi:hypothetical protein